MGEEMTVRISENKYCDPEARFAAEFEERALSVTDRSVVTIEISCYAPTRKQAKADMQKTLRAVIERLEQEMLT